MPRNIPLVLAVGVGLSVVLCAFFSSPGEPSCQGRCLSQWLDIYREGDSTPALGAEPEKAIRAIGTNAIPFLLKWISYEPPAWRLALVRYDVPDWLREDKQDDLAALACVGFRVLGPTADAAVPALTSIMHAPTAHFSSRRAMAALTALGSRAFLPVVLALTNHSWGVLHYGLSDPDWIRKCASQVGTNARPVVPVLIQCLERSEPWVATRAATILCHLKLEPDLVAQSVRPFLRHPEGRVRCLAASVLEALRFEAHPDVADLLMALNEPGLDAAGRARVTSELQAAAPRALGNVLAAAQAPAP